MFTHWSPAAIQNQHAGTYWPRHDHPLPSLFAQRHPSATSVSMHLLSQKEKSGVFKKFYNYNFFHFFKIV
jgi:hypothetical protein